MTQALLGYVEMGVWMQKLVMIHTNHGPGQSELENQCLKSTEVVTEEQRKTSRLRRGLRAQAGRCLGEQWLGLRPMSGLYLHVPGPLQGCRGRWAPSVALPGLLFPQESCGLISVKPED